MQCDPGSMQHQEPQEEHHALPNAPQRASTPVTMLIPAAMNAAPVSMPEQAPGIQAGTRLAMARGMSKCVMPKTTEQSRKDKGPRRSGC